MSVKYYLGVYIFNILIKNLLAFQYSDLMREYYLTCGADYFCFDVSKTKVWDVAPMTSYRHLGVCPECSCDKQCVRRGDCCPDLFFTFPKTECVNRTIIKGTDDRARDQRYSEYMVTRCPEKTEPELRHRCESNTDIKSRLINFPVTGRETPLTFYNTYCAECHGVTDYELWNLDIQCALFADFNYLSTIDDIIETAFDSFCTFQMYFPHIEIGLAPNCFEIDEDETLITKCNQTGKWEDFDKNILYGCEFYPKMQFRLFKNIFCYMCNPSEEYSKENEAISECNTTGQWETYDEQLEKACLELPKSLSTWPFKNIFCYLCNRRNNSENHFIDIKGSITEYYTNNEHFRYKYTVHVEAFDYDFLKYSLPLNLSVNENVSSEVHRPFSEATFKTANDTLINFYNLISQAIALDARRTGVCMSRSLMLPPGLNSQCVCDPKCVFGDMYNCCADLALEFQTTCVDELALSNIAEFRRLRKGYLLANGCFQEKTFTVFRDRCATRSLHDAYSIIPLTHNGRGVHYNNLYCVLCNMDSSFYVDTLNGFGIIIDINIDNAGQIKQERDIFTIIHEAEAQKQQYTAWNLDITCPTYLDFSHYVKLGNLLPTAWKSKCRILYNTSAKVSDACDERMEYGCGNLTGWTYSDPSVQWACQNANNFPAFYSIDIPDEYPNINITWKNKTSRPNHVSKYPNIFCALCSPLRNFSIEPIGSCNVTGLASANAFRNQNDLNCLQLPFIYYFYPFKNIFCVLCNGVPMMAVAPGSGPSDLPEYDRAAGITWFPLLRNLFSIYQDSNGKRDSIEETKSQCPDDQFFDFSTNECRNITCFPGKYLERKDCKSLLKITKNLRYSMRLMVGVKTCKPLEMGHLLPMVSSRITQSIDDLFVEEDPIVSLNELMGYTSCNTVIKKQTYFVANLELFFQMSLVRKDLEAKIVNIDWQLLNRSNLLYSIEIIKNASMQLTSFENSGDFCGIAANSLPLVVNTNGYYAAKVSEVLLCRQIELSRDEYNISDDKLHLTLTKLGKEVDNDHFALTPEGEVRVCYEYLMNMDYFGHAEEQTQVVSDPYLKYLWIVSLICTIISLMCLILGILMYCLFSVLRTTPGKLILLFMVSLFLTLLFQVLSFFVVSSYEGCIIVGIVSHFTWLSVFTSMQACNFHMYQVFSSNKPRSNHSGHFFDKSIALFTAYILFVPLIIVIANIGLTSAISQGRFLGFGGSKCFMDNTISVVLAFICPVLLICLSNIFFYCLTIRYIHRASNPTGKDRNRNELSIFSRLATITGISWILQIIDSFLPLTAFSFIAAMVNSLQGLFVFVAFVMNARNIALLREKFARDENRMANKSMSTSSTATATFRTTSYQKTASTKV